MAKNIADPALGAKVVGFTCCDIRHAPQNVLDGSDSTFWATTGMFPQEITIDLGQVSTLVKMQLSGMSIRKLAMDKCDQDTPQRFDRVFEVDIDQRPMKLSQHTHVLQNIRARFVRFVLLDGSEEFASLNRVQIFGSQ
ncbi:unnamed protein product [Pedinophyceae sp. YPF-701]|nr:unnamed protein product [Pedinophyceae sp. YPF-701]